MGEFMESYNYFDVRTSRERFAVRQILFESYANLVLIFSLMGLKKKIQSFKYRFSLASNEDKDDHSVKSSSKQNKKKNIKNTFMYFCPNI